MKGCKQILASKWKFKQNNQIEHEVTDLTVTCVNRDVLERKSWFVIIGWNMNRAGTIVLNVK